MVGLYRLACFTCDRVDYDLLTQEQFDKAFKTWRDVEEEQSLDEGTNADGSAWGKWWTHIGICPECYVSLNASLAVNARMKQRTLLED